MDFFSHFSSLDNIILGLITVIYGVYGLFSWYMAYLIGVKHDFSSMNAVDARTRVRIVKVDKFARQHMIPHLLLGLSCFVAVVCVFIFGFGSMAYAILFTLVCWIYGAIVAKRTPERIRRGYYE